MKNYQLLLDYIKQYDRLAVAYSGGVDSSLLLRAAYDALGADHVLAVTAKTELNCSDEFSEAAIFTKQLGIEHVMLLLDPLTNENVRNNTPDRCYYCKKTIFENIIKTAKEKGFSTVADGTNAEDQTAYRPGIRALKELSIISPLKECGFDKSEVRALSAALMIPQRNKPASPCLATRVPYNIPLTVPMIRQIEAGENFIKQSGIIHCRLRHHGDLARIEVLKEDIGKVISSPVLIDQIKSLGFRFVTVDLEGYRSGCFDGALKNS